MQSFTLICQKIIELQLFKLWPNQTIRATGEISSFFCTVTDHLFSSLPTCCTANSTTLKPVMSLYKQALKILDKKPKSHHHCSVLHKYRLLSWDNMITLKNCCLMFKIRFNLAPPPLCSLVKFRTPATSATRGAARGDCVIPLKKSVFGQSVFSIMSAWEWNHLPQNIRESTSSNCFKSNLKTWLINNQKCDH